MKNLDSYIKEIFKKMDIDRNNKVTTEHFTQIVTKEPNLLEVFDVLNKGLTKSIDQDNQTLKRKILANQLTHIGTQIDMLLLDLQGHNIFLKKMKTNENYTSSMSVSMKDRKKSSSPSKTKNLKKSSMNSIKKAENFCVSSEFRSTNSRNFNYETGFSPSFSDYKHPLQFNEDEEKFILKDEVAVEKTGDESPRSKLQRRKSRPAATMIVESPENKNKRKELFDINTTEKKIKRSLTPNQKEEKNFEFSRISENEEDLGTLEKDEMKKENSVVIDSFHSRTIKIITRLKEMKESLKTAQFCLEDLFDEKDETNKIPSFDDDKRIIIEEFRYILLNFLFNYLVILMNLMIFYPFFVDFWHRNKKDEMIYKKMKTITAQKIPKKSIFFKNKLRLEKSPKNKSAMVFLGHHNWNMVEKIEIPRLFY